MKMLKKISTFFMTLPLLVACGNKEEDKKDLKELYDIIVAQAKADVNAKLDGFKITKSGNSSISEESKESFKKTADFYNKILKKITGKDDGSIKINDFEYKKITVE